ncbi:hypothetical protein FSP39_008827 [Pinctada imbricata]|uniref:Uncharacterized protein n=1 Tax=Pinctada imbricata TaxID=66713 RepID=A0AA88YJC7_PINIB|nr:hypothetical protein FSP39_008827 [Pinctada imbricata]
MPRHKSVKALKSICITNIASNFDKFWCRSFDENFSDLPGLLYVIGPMEMLTSELTELLITELHERKLLKAKHFPLLFHDAVQKLDLQYCLCNLYKQDNLVQTIPWRCPRLVHLNLNNLSRLSKTTFYGLVENLPKLESLSLENTKCTDDILHSIGLYCKKLVSLNLQNCSSITDRGVKFLCENTLPNLRNVNLINTKVTLRGVVDVITKYPNLFELQHANSIMAFYDAYQKMSSGTNDTKLKQDQRKVRSLRYSHGAYMDGKEETLTTEMLEVVCKFCPLVTHVELYAIGNNSNILAFEHLKQLRRLEIVSEHLYDDFQIDFKGLCTLLNIIGSQISELVLSGMAVFSLEMIGNLCPNLRVLEISDCYDADILDKGVIMENKECFRKLRNFCIRDNAPKGKFSFYEQSFHTLFERSELLQHLEMWNVNTFSTETLENAISKHSFQYLKSMTLHECNNIDGEGIFSLLQTENDLSTLVSHQCHCVDRRDYHRYQRFCSQQNLDITISWT